MSVLGGRQWICAASFGTGDLKRRIGSLEMVLFGVGELCCMV